MDLRSALLAACAVGMSGLVVAATTAGARGAGVEVTPIDLGPPVQIAESLPSPAEPRTVDGGSDPVLPAPTAGAGPQVDDSRDDNSDADGERAPAADDDAPAASRQDGPAAPVRRAPPPPPKPAAKPAAPAPAPADDDEDRGSGGDRDDDADDRDDRDDRDRDAEDDRSDDAEDARDDADDDRDDLDD